MPFAVCPTCTRRYVIPHSDDPRNLCPTCDMRLQDTSKAFSIAREQRGALPVLRIHGDLDLATGPRLREAVIAALAGGAASLALDLSRVVRLDSSGLGVLVGARKRTAERGGSVFLIGVGDATHRILHLVSVEKLFHLCSEADLPQHAAAASGAHSSASVL